ncbi:MAG: hypothetical protein FWH14_03740 [Oscillospiraceae bacterium]|nr:hypothetical protein [Oscillospiraceae bacterium]
MVCRDDRPRSSVVIATPTERAFRRNVDYMRNPFTKFCPGEYNNLSREAPRLL